MGLFRDVLQDGESLFRDTVALDYDYLPKVIPYREREQRKFAFSIKPLLQGHNGRNLFVYGAPGIGKTAACKNVIRELQDETDEVIPLYVNCWKHNTVFKTLVEICNQLGLRLITNQKTSELFDRVKAVLNKKSAVFILDEVDKLENLDVLYMVLEDIYRKSVFLITNYKDKVAQLDERIMSRLNPELVEFHPYNKEETRGILDQRRKYAFVPGVWDAQGFLQIVEKSAMYGDIRKGLFLMREAGTIAEENASRVISADHVSQAIEKVAQFSANAQAELGEDEKRVFALIKKDPGQKIGDVFQAFLRTGGAMSYKNFTRKVDKLEKGKFIRKEKLMSKEGNTTLLHLNIEKRLSDY